MPLRATIQKNCISPVLSGVVVRFDNLGETYNLQETFSLN